MLHTLGRLLKAVQALAKLLPVVIEVLKDLGDDGRLNNSTGTNPVAKRKPKA